MAFSMLPALRTNDWRAVICVRVCRKWEYRGGTDDGPVQHVDLVLLDEQVGQSIIGEGRLPSNFYWSMYLSIYLCWFPFFHYRATVSMVKSLDLRFMQRARS